MRESSIRCTVVDESGTVTFVGPGHLIKVLTASCARGVATTRELLQRAEPYDAALIRDLAAGLAIFDEHNVDTQHSAIDERLDQQEAYLLPARVIDERTRQLSLAPVGAGLVVFNLKAHRIVQVQNTYAEILRRDRGRVRVGGEPTDTLFHYQLPVTWSILP